MGLAQDVLVAMQTCVSDMVAVTGCVRRLAEHRPAAKVSLVRQRHCWCLLKVLQCHRQRSNI